MYFDPWIVGFDTGVRRGHQKILEGTKTIVGVSNRFRVVTDVMYDDFMQFGKPLGVKQVPAPLAAPPGASPSFRLRGRGHPAARCGFQSRSQKMLW